MLIGCHPSYFEDIDLTKALEYTQYAMDEKLAGIMIWSLQRDTNHRTESGDCNDFQTGQQDGLFLSTIASVLNA